MRFVPTSSHLSAGLRIVVAAESVLSVEAKKNIYI